jgi:hypothetical protein
MPSINAPDITDHQRLAFQLNGITPAGETFVEPAVTVGPPAFGTVALQPSVQGTPNTDGSVPFTTAGIFTPSGALGAVTLSAVVNGVDDQDATFNVVAHPLEAVAFDTTKFAALPAA